MERHPTNSHDPKNHKLTKDIPIHLRPYIVKQDPALYTPMDHASWRFTLKVLMAYFKENAHQKYQDGLRETGISTDRIPLIDEMDACLRKFNWRAVAVSGFIPPAVFMEFLSLGVLPIACDMRTIDHLAYTPAPDIVHEAAGHAPIIADPEYSDYLRSYGDVSRKAIFSIQDMEVYNAIRLLSDTKENPKSTAEEIDSAQKKLDQAISLLTYESEATLLSRMAWWTFEYGLVGDLKKTKIYGAGLLSSMGESFHCFDPQVKKVPFSLKCIETTYDITRPQPQLFVTRSFQELKDVLEELANQMAFRQGGVQGLEKAKKAKTATTTVFNTGIQISGVLADYRLNSKGEPYFLKWAGPTQLALEDQEIEGQGTGYHKEGFSTSLEKISELELKQSGFIPNKIGKLNLLSGLSLEGKLVNVLKHQGETVLLTFEECTLKEGDEFLFRPEWGKFDMACGNSILSVFGGAADRKKYFDSTAGFQQESGKQKTNLTDENKKLNEYYFQVRQLRDIKAKKEVKTELQGWVNSLTVIYHELKDQYPNDWLIRYELLELVIQQGVKAPWEKQIREDLHHISVSVPDCAETIQRGLELLQC